ncbi:RNA export factor GLE2 [Ascoidea rubescens DSM 1968]|uniref:Nucleoporin GLE2 n=1 Tax=Ascoidea rubescens DSM 1968 TaxID=1344418 RepID=A0A1D2VP61_9ASCO|nr:nucleoporin GLE2 [Ascoidea rubescens DSM 1968]ODV63401.1 nucleoporin GLE2 [Ascoidea rubescens DSM 1968]
MSLFPKSNILGASAAASNVSDTSYDITVQNPPEDGVTDLAFSSQGDFLSVSSWDSKVRVYEVFSNGTTQGKAFYQHEAPVLTTRWTADGTKIISGSCDKTVKLYDVASGLAQQVGAHDAPVSQVRFVQCGPSLTQVIASASWDKTLKYWDSRSPSPVSTINLPERCYTMDSQKKLLVVGCADRKICIIDLNDPTTIFREISSPLKYQTRVISCFNEGNGYAVVSIEGRCAIRYLDPSDSQREFTFKCHREQDSQTKNTKVYSVNAISFHPVHGTFCTGGSDGSIIFWDKDQRHKLKQMTNLGSSVTATTFNSSGTIFAYALGYDWSKGYTYSAENNTNVIKLHAVQDDEAKPKQVKKKF